MMNFSKTLLLTLLCISLVAVPLPAQETPSQAEPESDQPLETLRSEVNVVSLFFNVKDKKKGMVAGLTKDDFEVFEDGKPQNIKYFSATTDQPLTLGVLIDTSGSMRRVLPIEQEVGGDFLAQILRPKDLAFIINFDIGVELVQDLTSSTRDLRSSLKRVRINAPNSVASGGGVGLPGTGGNPVPTANVSRGTVLFDAIYLACDEKLKTEVGRKAIIILSDGQDEGSRMKLRDAMEAAQKADAIVYVLLVTDYGFNFNRGIGYVGDDDMKKLAEQTGGRLIEVSDDEKKLRQAFDQIAAEMRSQYSLGYTPLNKTMDGSFRKVQIKPKNKDLKVQARTGYFAQKPSM